MSTRHQANRRRTYGRRKHQQYERTGRPIGILGWVEVDVPGVGERLGPESQDRSQAGDALVAGGTD
jgi:hypothetical protein